MRGREKKKKNANAMEKSSKTTSARRSARRSGDTGAGGSGAGFLRGKRSSRSGGGWIARRGRVSSDAGVERGSVCGWYVTRTGPLRRITIRGGKTGRRGEFRGPGSGEVRRRVTVAGRDSAGSRVSRRSWSRGCRAVGWKSGSAVGGCRGGARIVRRWLIARWKVRLPLGGERRRLHGCRWTGRETDGRRRRLKRSRPFRWSLSAVRWQVSWRIRLLTSCKTNDLDCESSSVRRTIAPRLDPTFV